MGAMEDCGMASGVTEIVGGGAREWTGSVNAIPEALPSLQ
jgi:hypothetical protein